MNRSNFSLNIFLSDLVVDFIPWLILRRKSGVILYTSGSWKLSLSQEVKNIKAIEASKSANICNLVINVRYFFILFLNRKTQYFNEMLHLIRLIINGLYNKTDEILKYCIADEKNYNLMLPITVCSVSAKSSAKGLAFTGIGSWMISSIRLRSPKGKDPHLVIFHALLIVTGTT